MVLNDEQNDLFFDTMDSLLYYVNDRFRVVEGFSLDRMEPLDEVKCSIVAQTLWDNVEIVDDFVRENPYRLSRTCLELAQSWKSALPGMFTLVRYQSGRALMMGQAGVFSVCGVTYELEQEVGRAPAYVETTLLPFGDLIVYDGFLQAYDTDDSAEELQRIQDEFEDRCAKGIAVTGQEFCAVADAHLAEQRDRALDELLADVSREAQRGADEPPEGYHRGALAGLDPGQREQALRDELGGVWVLGRPNRREFEERACRHQAVESLRGCLMLMTRHEMASVAGLLGMSGVSGLRKAELADRLTVELPHRPDVLEEMLTLAPSAHYALLRTLAVAGRVDFADEDLAEHASDWPIEPYTVLFAWKGAYTALVPVELRPLLRELDFDAIDIARRHRSQAMRCMDMCVLQNGVVSVDDVYEQYRALVADVLPRDEFDALARMEAEAGLASYDLWTCPPNDYLVHYTLSADYVAREFAQSQYDGVDAPMVNVDTGEIRGLDAGRMLSRMGDGLRSELEWLEQYKRDLVEMQKALPMKPLSRTVLENDPMIELLNVPAAMSLRAYLDAHVPDGEDDYSFADRVVDEVVLSSIEMGNLQALFDYMASVGMERCAQADPRLNQLVANVYNSMPSWENNGWSPQELLEQVTGRKVFYNEDGSVMKVGADEPCPCKSGKKYRDCCGR